MKSVSRRGESRRGGLIVTTPDFTPAEQAAWRVAVDRGLAIEAADLRALIHAYVVADTRQSDPEG